MSTNNMFPELNIGHGLELVFNDDGWIVRAGGSCFPLTADSDYFRVVSLLEMPYQEAASLLDAYQAQGQINTRFPLEKVVRVGLNSKSEHWAERAVNWFVSLTPEWQGNLVSDLQEVADSKWANQKTRQVALREIRRLTN